MTKLLSAYVALGLPAGSSLADVLRRHRWLACAFHPDRMPETKKAAAEREMKRINNARDELSAHYAKCHRHKDETCRCEPFYATCSQGCDAEVPTRSADVAKPTGGAATKSAGCYSGTTATGNDAGKPTRGGARTSQTDSRGTSGDTTSGAYTAPFDWYIKTEPKPDKSTDALQRFAWRLLLIALVWSVILTVVDRVEEAFSGRTDTSMQSVQ